MVQDGSKPADSMGGGSRGRGDLLEKGANLEWKESENSKTITADNSIIPDKSLYSM